MVVGWKREERGGKNPNPLFILYVWKREKSKGENSNPLFILDY